MANFATHIGVGTVVSGALATVTLGADVIDRQSLVAVALAGVVGSILPDIDLKDSRPSKALFSGLAIFFSFAVLFCAAGKYSLVELWILWLGTLGGIRYGAHAVFHQIAIHRGVWHSLLAAVFSALCAVLVFKYMLGFHDGIAWLGGAFLAAGYLTHLILDELYSVDVMDTRIKASFGTALKLADFSNWRHSVAMLVLTVGAAAVAPSPDAFLKGLSSERMWAELNDRMLPKAAWFGVVGFERRVAVTPTAAEPAERASGAPLTTGTIVSRNDLFRTIATEEPRAPDAAAPPQNPTETQPSK